MQQSAWAHSVSQEKLPFGRQLQRRPGYAKEAQLVFNGSPDIVVTGQVLRVKINREKDPAFRSDGRPCQRIHIICDRVSRRKSYECRPERLDAVGKERMHIRREPVSLTRIVGCSTRLSAVSRLIAPAICFSGSIREDRPDIPERFGVLLRDSEHRSGCIRNEIGWMKAVDLLCSIPLLDLKLEHSSIECAQGGPSPSRIPRAALSVPMESGG
jgi:hypothetical protein